MKITKDIFTKSELNCMETTIRQHAENRDIINEIGDSICFKFLNLLWDETPINITKAELKILMLFLEDIITFVDYGNTMDTLENSIDTIYNLIN